ncbi:type II secretion system secretin GspD [Planctomycetales bacterium ZRK34]|nr:type II secretion system secretin GspD [Planctomycetales bacterium ZRK34]
MNHRFITCLILSMVCAFGGPGFSDDEPAATDQPAAATPAPATGVPAAPVTPAAPAEPAVPVAPKEPVEPPAPLATPDAPILMNFRDATIDTVLDHLAEVAGLVIIKPAEVTGRITVINRKPMSVDEAVAVLDTVLRGKGYAAVRMNRTLKIVPVAQATKSAVPVHVGADPDKIALTDQVITQVVPIQNAEATQLLKDLTPVLSDNAAATSNAGSNTIVITDTSANVNRIVQVISAMDLALTTASEVKVFPLQYARASDTAKLINNTFGQNAQNQSRSGRDRFRPFFGRGRDRDNNEEQPGVRSETPAVASADDRTNTVVVTASASMIEVITDVIKQLDANPVAQQAVFVYKVVHADAENLQTVLSNIFGTSTTSSSGSTNVPGNAANRERGSRSNTTNNNNNNDPRAAFREAFARAAGNLSQDSLEAASDLRGQVEVVADADTNSLLVMTAPTNFDRVRQIISELDRDVPQVLIKVLIAEVTHSDGVDVGAEFSVLDAPNASNLFTDFGVEAAADASGGFAYKMVAGDVSATLRALEEVGKLEILSRPYILAADNQEASITVGSEVPFIRNTRVTDNGDTINTIQYDDVGILLTVTPQINDSGLVTMNVAPEISAISGDTVPISETVDAPVIEKRSASTRVSIPTGKTIVIGGLMQDQKTATISKVPLLGDIPLVGLLFQRQQNEKRKTELLIFLTPHIASQPEQLEDISADEQRGTQIVPHAVQPGEFNRHLRGMQRGDGQEHPAPDYDPDAKNPTNAPNEIDPMLRLPANQ